MLNKGFVIKNPNPFPGMIGCLDNTSVWERGSILKEGVVNIHPFLFIENGHFEDFLPETFLNAFVF